MNGFCGTFMHAQDSKVAIGIQMQYPQVATDAIDPNDCQCRIIVLPVAQTCGRAVFANTQQQKNQLVLACTYILYSNLCVHTQSGCCRRSHLVQENGN